MQSALENPETFINIFFQSFIQHFWSTFCLKNGLWATEVSTRPIFQQRDRTSAANAKYYALAEAGFTGDLQLWRTEACTEGGGVYRRKQLVFQILTQRTVSKKGMYKAGKTQYWNAVLKKTNKPPQKTNSHQDSRNTNTFALWFSVIMWKIW